MGAQLLALTFILGGNGMNFEFVTGLPRVWGFCAVWLVMLGVSTATWTRLRRRGWIS